MGHPIRTDVAESAENLGWVGLALIPVGLYALVLQSIRRRAGVTGPEVVSVLSETGALKGLVQIAEDRVLSEETESALAQETGFALGSVPRSCSLAWRADDGALVGHLRFVVVAETCEVDLMWVAKSHRCSGIGSSLVKAAQSEAHAIGARKIFARVGSWENAAFFQRMGFEITWDQEISPKAKWIWLEKPLA